MSNNTKQEIVNWLVTNDALMQEVMQNVQKRLIKNEYLFDADIKEQYMQEVQKMMGIELGKSLGIALEQFHEHITPEMLNKFIDHVEKN